jgi:signal transduction histidine kinase
VLEDASRALAYPGVTEANFAPLAPADVNIGYSSSVFWLRVHIATDADEATSWILEPSHAPDRAELYDGQGDGASVRRSGKLEPRAESDLRASAAAFRVELPPHADRTLYLRLESTDTIGLAIELTDARAFAERARRENLFAGAYYGLLLGIILYNFFLYLSTRDRPYLLYVVFQTSFVLVQASMDRFGFEYLWAGSTWFAERSDEVTATFTMFAAVRFGSAFLETRRWPRLHRALGVAAVLSLGLTVAALVRDNAAVKLAFAVVFLGTIALLMFAAIRATRAGTPNGRFFLAGWTFFILGCFVHMLSAVGVLAMSAAPGLAVLKLGSAAEATLLSLGLGNRLRLLRDSARRSQALLLEEREAHARMLEARVDERTRELRAAQDLLVRQERLATLGRLAAGVGHEVGNPLNFVAGGATELAQALDRGELGDARRALRLVVSGSDRIKKVVTNLRRYVASEHVVPEPTDVVASLAATLELTADLCARCGVTVVRTFEPLPLLAARPGELEQVFTNIVLNACHAMTGGGTLAVSAAVAGGSVEIRFADDGPGVPPEMREVIFEAFARGATGGSGLGLFVSREIVARHGGELRYEGGGAGATFVVTLPIA